MWSLLWKGFNVYINGPGHMTKISTTPIYGKNLQKIFSYRTTCNSPLIMRRGMEQYVIKLYKVYINDNPKLILTNFTTMPNLTKLVSVLIVL